MLKSDRGQNTDNNRFNRCDTAARIEKRACEIGLTPSQFVAALVRNDAERDNLDPFVGEELGKRWAEIKAGGETVPHAEVKRWLKTWGTPSFKPWAQSR